MRRGVLVWLQEPEVPLQALREAGDTGADAVLLRRPGASAQAMRDGALRVRQAGLSVIVNDRLDVALALQVPCQLRHDSLPPDLARLLAPRLPLGASVHEADDVRRAVDAGVDYLVFGHVFPTASKAGAPPRGVKALAAVVRASGVPVLAIGGVTAGNVAEVLAAGAAGVVVRSGIGQASAAEDAHALRLALDAGPAPPAVLTRNLREVLHCASA